MEYAKLDHEEQEREEDQIEEDDPEEDQYKVNWNDPSNCEEEGCCYCGHCG